MVLPLSEWLRLALTVLVASVVATFVNWLLSRLKVNLYVVLFFTLFIFGILLLFLKVT